MDDSRVTFGGSQTGMPALADDVFLRSIVWSRSAPSAVTESAGCGDVAAFYRALKKEGFGSFSRTGSKRVSSTRAREKEALWSLGAFELEPRTRELVEFWEEFKPKSRKSLVKIGAKSKRRRSKAGKPKRESHRIPGDEPFDRLDRWLAASTDDEPVTPLELLVLFELLSELGGSLPVSVGWRLWRTALTAAIGLSGHCDHSDGGHAEHDQRLLIEGELPWKAGLLFDGVKGARKLNRSGRKVLRRQLKENTDTDGTPCADLLERMSLWLAALVRSAHWAERAKVSLWDESSAERFGFLLECAAAVCRADGRLALSNGFSHNVAGLLALAARLAGWKKKSPPSKYLSSVGVAVSEPRLAGGGKRVDPDDYPTTQSDWAQLACLRNNWSTTPDTLVVAHHRGKPMIDLTALGRPLISGVWDIDVQIDGAPIRLKNDWECTCWYSDQDADFIELHVSLDNHVEIDRQLLLSRSDHFAVLADAVSAAEGCRIEYRSRLPLVSGVVSRHDQVTRECGLKRQRVHARAFPLALPCDRVESAAGAFVAHNDSLELEQQGESRLYAPLVIDWAPERRRSYADWRSLTVTEDRTVVKRCSAAGHRIRIGAHQLLIYRSLDRTGELRCLLGHHTDHETVIGTFDEDGVVDPILMVE